MKGFLFCTLLIVLFSCPALADTIEGDYVEGDVIVVLEAPPFSDYPTMEAYSQVLWEQAEALISKFEFIKIVGTPLPYGASITGKSTILLRSEYKSTEELIKELSSAPGVISVEPNYIGSIQPPAPQEPSNSRQGGGGCNAGYGSILLLLACLVFFGTKNKVGKVV